MSGSAFLRAGRRRRTCLAGDEREIVDRLASVFADRADRFWEELDGNWCPCGCNKFVDVIAGRALSLCSDEDIGEMMRSSLTTIGDSNTVKGLLPEFFASALSGGSLIDTWLVRQKLEEAGIDDWPDGERGAAAAALVRWAEQTIRIFEEDGEEADEDDLASLAWAQARAR